SSDLEHTEQLRVDVGGGDQLDSVDRLAHGTYSDSAQAVQSGRARIQWHIGAGAQSRQGSGAAVGGRAASQSDHDRGGPGAYRLENCLADAARTGIPGRELIAQMQAA